MVEKGEEEKIKKVVELRAKLQKRVNEMEAELEGLKVLLKLVDDTLLEKGFKRAEIEKPVPPPPETEAVLTPTEVAPPPAAEYDRSIPIKTVTGDLLANFHVKGDSIRIVLAEDKTFDINTPPFTSFLVDRVLAKMQEKDRKDASTGEITPDKILSYNIVRDGDLIREIAIKNIKPERSRELKSSIRWTLEKMYEKTMQMS